MSLQEQIQNQLNSSFVAGQDYFEDPEVYEQEILSGVHWDKSKYRITRLDEHCPYKQGQLTTVVGHSNVGKTTLITFLLTRVLQQRKLIVYSAENRISQLARYIISFSTGSHDYQKYFGWLRSHVKFIKHIKQYTYKDVLEQVSIADDIGFNSSMIFIDPYNSLKKDRRNMNSHEYDYEAIEDMRIFCKNANKSIYLNCHTNTEAMRNKPDKDGHVPRPMSSDVEGGGKFINKSDDVWVIHRQLHASDKEKRYESLLFVDKVRNTEGGGYPTPYNEPIYFRFQKDWTGFDAIGGQDPANFYEVERQNNIPF